MYVTWNQEASWTPGWWCYLHVHTCSAGDESHCRRVLMGNEELHKQNRSAESLPRGRLCSGSVSSWHISLYLCWILCPLGFSSESRPWSPVYLLVLSSHYLVCIPAKRILPLHLFSLGKDGWGISPPASQSCVVLKLLLLNVFVYVDVHVHQLREGKAPLIDLL